MVARLKLDEDGYCTCHRHSMRFPNAAHTPEHPLCHARETLVHKSASCAQAQAPKRSESGGAGHPYHCQTRDGHTLNSHATIAKAQSHRRTPIETRRAARGGHWHGVGESMGQGWATRCNASQHATAPSRRDPPAPWEARAERLRHIRGRRKRNRASTMKISSPMMWPTKPFPSTRRSRGTRRAWQLPPSWTQPRGPNESAQGSRRHSTTRPPGPRCPHPERNGAGASRAEPSPPHCSCRAKGRAPSVAARGSTWRSQPQNRQNPRICRTSARRPSNMVPLRGERTPDVPRPSILYRYTAPASA